MLLSVAYIGHNSRTERPRKTKIGIEVAHVTRDLDTTFKVKRSKVDVWEGGGSILWRLVIHVGRSVVSRCKLISSVYV